ncbi:hypothetical protein NPIL_570171 [Nephila pilipes]|uniref:Uncharacterized protein n=1 Tax=Nephila pilipes TaxID=299642 RepID=A0A8X6MX38_NEPPI|nr:hypothetical protein NPIL_570171 [Nephila pilipes]
MLLPSSDDEEIVSELKYYIYEAPQLSSDGDEYEIKLTDSIYLSKDKSIQYRSEPSLQVALNKWTQQMLNLSHFVDGTMEQYPSGVDNNCSLPGCTVNGMDSIGYLQYPLYGGLGNTQMLGHCFSSCSSVAFY